MPSSPLSPLQPSDLVPRCPILPLSTLPLDYLLPIPSPPTGSPRAHVYPSSPCSLVPARTNVPPKKTYRHVPPQPQATSNCVLSSGRPQPPARGNLDPSRSRVQAWGGLPFPTSMSLLTRLAASPPSLHGAITFPFGFTSELPAFLFPRLSATWAAPYLAPQGAPPRGGRPFPFPGPLRTRVPVPPNARAAPYLAPQGAPPCGGRPPGRLPPFPVASAPARRLRPASSPGAPCLLCHHPLHLQTKPRPLPPGRDMFRKHHTQISVRFRPISAPLPPRSYHGPVLQQPNIIRDRGWYRFNS